MKKVYHHILLILLTFGIINSLQAQFALESIKSDYQKGNLSYEQYLEYGGLSLFAPEHLPKEYILQQKERPLRNGTILVQEIKANWEKLNPSVRQILQGYLMRHDDLPYKYTSHSGRFRIHYTTDGTNAVELTDTNKNDIPDYVENVGFYADYAHQLIVDSLGYQSPPADSNGLGTKFDIYLVQIFDYGVTYLERKVPNSDLAYSCYIEIENDFRGFPTPPLSSLRVTLAHEYFHVVQVGYAFREEDIFYMEMSSTWMEEYAHPDVNDYLNYLDSFFRRINYPFSYTNGGYEYGAALWNHMITKKYDVNLIWQIWENTPDKNVMNIMPGVLRNYNTSFNDELASFGLWNYFTGDRADTINFYPEGDLYPSVRFQDNFTIYGGDLVIESQMNKMSSTMFQVRDVAHDLDIGLIVTNFSTPTKTIDGNFNLSDKADFRIDIINIPSDDPKNRTDFLLRNNLIELSDYHGIRLNVANKTLWHADAVVTYPDNSYEIVPFFPGYENDQNNDRNYIENIYPNPLIVSNNRPVTITFYVHDDEWGNLTILSQDGRLIIKHRFNATNKFFDFFEWNGKDQNGNLVGSGIYLVALQVGKQIDLKKLALVRN